MCHLVLGGDKLPENKRLTYLEPLIFSRRQLHVLVPSKGNIRKKYGSTLSLGIKRGTLVKHEKYGYCLIGGNMNNKLSLHNLIDYKRLTKKAKLEDLKIKTYVKYKMLFLV